MKRNILVVSLILSCFSVIMILIFCRYDERSVEVVPATCMENGYSVYKKSEKTQIKDIVQAKGHRFSEWEMLTEPQGVNKGTRKHRCSVCGYEETENFFADSLIPRIMFTGNLTGIGKKDLVVVEAVYCSDDLEFEGYATLKYQGHSSLRYDKKNFTVKFFQDKECSDKKEIQFRDWNKENKFILKANYIDVSRSRNLICADIWSEMVVTRNAIHSRLAKSSNYGAVDGFPVEVYLNDEFLGIYNLTLHKDDSLFAMNDGKKDGIMIINKGNSQEGLFRKTVEWETNLDWEVEFCGTEDDAWLREKTNAFIEFIMTSTDKELKRNLPQYADVESLIDYLIAIYVLGLNSNYSKDLIFFTYEDSPFIASLFDMENAFGMKNDGTGFETLSCGLPIKKDGKWYSGTDSLLWDRIISNYYSEIQERYKNLRQEILSEKNVFSTIENRIYSVPETINMVDMEIYNKQPLQDISHISQIKTYTKERIAKLDSIFGYTIGNC